MPFDLATSVHPGVDAGDTAGAGVEGPAAAQLLEHLGPAAEALLVARQVLLVDAPAWVRWDGGITELSLCREPRLFVPACVLAELAGVAAGAVSQATADERQAAARALALIDRLAPVLVTVDGGSWPGSQAVSTADEVLRVLADLRAGGVAAVLFTTDDLLADRAAQRGLPLRSEGSLLGEGGMTYNLSPDVLDRVVAWVRDHPGPAAARWPAQSPTVDGGVESYPEGVLVIGLLLALATWLVPALAAVIQSVPHVVWAAVGLAALVGWYVGGRRRSGCLARPGGSSSDSGDARLDPDSQPAE